MKNEVFYPTSPDAKLSLPVLADAPSGSPVVVGSIIGVAATDEGKGGNIEGNASVWTEGVYDFAVGTTTAVAVGAPVYITSGYALTPSASGNTLFGYALEAKGTTAGEIIRIKLAKV